MDLSPRLKQMLLLVLNSDFPMSVQNLAVHLQISKRTVFRELEGINSMMAAYNLKLETKSKRGIYLSGAQIDKDTLFKIVNTREFNDPRNIKERHNRLLLELLRQKEPSKIFYFSKLLGVSDGTINNDLDSLEEWLSQSNIRLVRKPGRGIYISCCEENYRKACMRYVHQNMKENISPLYNLVSHEIAGHVIEAIKQTQHKKLTDMTDFSYTSLIIFLSIMVHRVLMGRYISECGKVSESDKETDDYGFVLKTIDILHKRLNVAYPVAEADYLFTYIKGARLQHVVKVEPIEGYFDLQYMVYDMIHQYDPALAFELKNDKSFVDGLISHLKHAIVRLQNGHEIFNKFQQEILSSYPDIYTKTKSAASVLEKTLQCIVPDDEVGLLALHFCGASMRLKDNVQACRKANLGVVCASGIGFSMLLHSRLSYIFCDKVTLKCLSLSEFTQNAIAGLDFIISTVNLPLAPNKYLLVHPMLTDNDIANISDKIASLTLDTDLPAEYFGANLLNHVDEIKLISSEVGSLLRLFRLYHINADISFSGLLIETSKLMSRDESTQVKILNALIEKEALSTQVIPEYEIALLHTKTTHIQESVFALIRPENGIFSTPKLAGIKVAVVMLVPENDLRRTFAITAISAEIFGNDIFLRLIKSGAENEIQLHIEKILHRYLIDNVNLSEREWRHAC